MPRFYEAKSPQIVAGFFVGQQTDKQFTKYSQKRVSKEKSDEEKENSAHLYTENVLVLPAKMSEKRLASPFFSKYVVKIAKNCIKK